MLKKNIAERNSKLIIIPAILFLVISSGIFAQNQDSLWTARYNWNMAGLQQLNKDIVDYQFQMDLHYIDAPALKNDIDTLKRYNFWLNLMINECNHLMYPNNDIGKNRIYEVDRWIAGNKTAYTNAMHTLQINYENFQNKKLNEDLQKMFMNIIYMQLKEYISGGLFDVLK